MKKLITLFVLFFCLNADAQYVNIPDSNFRNFLIGKFPSCFNSSKEMDTTCFDVITNTIIKCDGLNIKNLDGISFFKNLKVLNCYDNQLISLPSLPDSLTNLLCGENVLKTLPFLPSGVKQLYCGRNQLTRLLSLPSSLTDLNCESNQLDSLPELPLILINLSCSDNPLISLPVLPNKLASLTCRFNQIINLPALPNSLKYLYCAFNSLINLPTLPDSLEEIDCQFNQLPILTGLPNSLTYLNCSSNKLGCIPLLPGNISNLICNNNNISCIPNLPNNFFKSSIKLLCNPTNNINNCQSFPTIHSYTYTDIANKFPKQKIKLNLSNSNHTYTNQQGTAYINADSLGTYTITAQAPPLYLVVPPSYTHTFNRYDTIVYDTFALQPLFSKDSLAVKITPINWAARPGFSYAYNINFENVGTTIVNSNLNVKLDTSKYIFDSCSNVNSSFTSNTLSLLLNNFVPGQNGDFIIYGKLKTTTSLGSNLIATASFMGGNATATDTVNTIVRGSYDPNDKQATPNLSVAQVASDNNYINYTIRFQNTGTDTAFNVVIADSLNGNMLQLNTLQVIGSSHMVKPTQKDNVVFFEFRDINLPDSNTNKVGSNGFVNFKIKPKTTLTNGNVVPNNAAIYFDYNSPIITNTANTFIGTLPLTLLNFMASPTPPKEGLINVLLSWNTSNEINTSHFVIEQSTGAKNFKAITEVKAKGIGSNSYYYQSSVDRQLSTVFFRLKMIDKDGKFSYSPIREIRTQKSETITIISPVKNELKVVVNSNSLINTKASIINILGKVVNEFVLSNNVNSINISSLVNGVYYLNTVDGSRKFVITN